VLWGRFGFCVAWSTAWLKMVQEYVGVLCGESGAQAFFSPQRLGEESISFPSDGHSSTFKEATVIGFTFFPLWIWLFK